MIFFAVLAAVFAALAAMRLLGLDGNRYTAALLALVPYWIVGGLILGGVALGLRQWWSGGVVLVLTLALVAVVLPRTFLSLSRTRTAQSCG